MTSVEEVRHEADSDEAFRKVLKGVGEATTVVATDPQVFERITLGLYREPASAIRELISNAYDADATMVSIDMDQPQFNSIVVKDNGRGMSAGVIDYLVHHVGGSLKRTEAGLSAGVIAERGKSPGGRNLIGQMGIGLYSIARLTRRFSIHTKQKGEKHRFVLEVDLTGLDKDAPLPEGAETYIAGYAKVRRFAVSQWEFDDNGTTVVLHNVLQEARDILQSRDRWELRVAKATKEVRGELKYHIGFPGAGQSPNLPWSEIKSPTPLQKFKALAKSLSTSEETAGTSPSLDQTLDYYLALLWRLSLSAPLKYMEKHPFELTTKDEVEFYTLAGDGTPEQVELPDGKQIGNFLDVHEEGKSDMPFSVEIDGIELRRPIVFRGIDADNRKLLTRPKMFIGRFASERLGARLSGTAYFFWNYNIRPKENNGILVRIAGASGELFDARFLNYRTSENLRLRQVSAEAFVEYGFENALNVDRESYVETDPSVRALQRWTHRSMTRIFSRLKMDQKAAALRKREGEDEQLAEETEGNSEEIWRRHRPKDLPPAVIVSSRQSAPPDLEPGSIFVGGVESDRRGGVERETVFSARLRSIVLILEAHRLLDRLSDDERSQLINEIASILDRD